MCCCCRSFSRWIKMIRDRFDAGVGRWRAARFFSPLPLAGEGQGERAFPLRPAAVGFVTCYARVAARQHGAWFVPLIYRERLAGSPPRRAGYFSCLPKKSNQKKGTPKRSAPATQGLPCATRRAGRHSQTRPFGPQTSESRNPRPDCVARLTHGDPGRVIATVGFFNRMDRQLGKSPG